MDENKRTIVYVAAAIVLVLLALLVAPRHMSPEAFSDQGEPFFPDFTDPNTATSLEVIAYNEATGQATPFKVTRNHGIWTIPSEHNYPADGAKRLASTAAGIIQLKRDEFRTDNVNDYEACGVIDPLDENSTSLAGRGQRVTVKGENETVLADLIIGKNVPGRSGFRFVRVPSERRVYAAKVDFDISTRFADWIDTDLLKVASGDIKRVVIDNYSVNERTSTVEPKERTALTLDGGEWKADRLDRGHKVDTSAVKNLLKAIDELAIDGVSEKPGALAEQLSDSAGEMSMTQADLIAMQNSGFFLSRDGGVLANEGEVHVYTRDGVIYELRFGEVAYGRDDAAGSNKARNSSATQENRYVFVTARFNSKLFPEPKRPTDTSFVGKPDSLLTDQDKANKAVYDVWHSWKLRVDKAKEKVRKANRRFARWFYLISADQFEKVRVPRSDLIVKKT